MPDFAIIPELPAGYPINSRRSVARIVSVQTVVVSEVPTVAFPITETDMFAVVSFASLPAVRPNDQIVVVSEVPTVAFPTTETGVFTLVSLTSLPVARPNDQLAQDLTAPSVPVAVTESPSASIRVT